MPISYAAALRKDIGAATAAESSDRQCCEGACVSRVRGAESTVAFESLDGGPSDAAQIGSAAYFLLLLDVTDQAIGHCEALAGPEPTDGQHYHRVRIDRCRNFAGFFYPRAVEFRFLDPRVHAPATADHTTAGRLMNDGFVVCADRLQMCNDQLIRAWAAYMDREFISITRTRDLYRAFLAQIAASREAVVMARKLVELYQMLYEYSGMSEAHRTCDLRVLDEFRPLTMDNRFHRDAYSSVPWASVQRNGFPAATVLTHLTAISLDAASYWSLDLGPLPDVEAAHMVRMWTQNLYRLISYTRFVVDGPVKFTGVLPNPVLHAIGAVERFNDKIRALVQAMRAHYPDHHQTQIHACVRNRQCAPYEKALAGFGAAIGDLHLFLRLFVAMVPPAENGDWRR